jgi:signal transduction histidine kinase
MAANSDGVWNEAGDRLDFTIPPTFLQSRWFYALCVAMISGLFVLLFWVRLTQLSGRMRMQLEARMLERERIARELHDTLLQGFQGLMLRFQSVADRIPPEQPARALIEEVMVRGDEVLAQGRDRVRELRGAEVEEELPVGLQKYARHFAAESAANVHVEVDGTPRVLHPVVNDELIAICGEAVANAVKHAQASKIDVRVIYQRGGVRLVVSDDGIGIEPGVLEAGRSGHFGLAGMRERAHRIRAEFMLSSRGHAGTRVEVRVPASVAYARRPTRMMRLRSWATVGEAHRA